MILANKKSKNFDIFSVTKLKNIISYVVTYLDLPWFKLQVVPEDVLKCELDLLGANDQAARVRIVRNKTRL